MPDISPSLPIAGQPNSTEEPKIVTALSQLVGAVNNVDDSQLASPNNGVWRTIHEGVFSLGNAIHAAGTYWLNAGGQPLGSGSGAHSFVGFIYFDPAAYAVAGKTAQLRLNVNGLSGTSIGQTPTFGLYPIASTAPSGGTLVILTLTTVVAGSTVAVAPVANSGSNPGVSSGFAVPAAGTGYVFGFSLPGSTTSPACFTGSIRLELSYT